MVFKTTALDHSATPPLINLNSGFIYEINIFNYYSTCLNKKKVFYLNRYYNNVKELFKVVKLNLLSKYTTVFRFYIKRTNELGLITLKGVKTLCLLYRNLNKYILCVLKDKRIHFYRYNLTFMYSLSLWKLRKFYNVLILKPSYKLFFYYNFNSINYKY